MQGDSSEGGVAWLGSEIVKKKKKLRQNSDHDNFLRDFLCFDQHTNKNTFQCSIFQVTTLNDCRSQEW